MSSHLSWPMPMRRKARLPLRLVLLSLAVHALILWKLPLHSAQEPAATPVLSLSLQAPLPSQPATPTRSPAVEAVATVKPRSPAPAAPAPTAPTPVAPVPGKPPSNRVAKADPAGESPAARERSSMRLLDNLRRDLRVHAAKPASEAEPLGRSTRNAAYEQSQRALIPARTNLFDGMAAPAVATVTDRWLRPDGTHEVVMQAPDGHSYCGRQPPVDPMRPWLQMPMLWHRCAGGGPRKTTTGTAE